MSNHLTRYEHVLKQVIESGKEQATNKAEREALRIIDQATEGDFASERAVYRSFLATVC